jgi:DnaJ-class molecular chaperone
MNYYEILDLSPSATSQQIRRAHRELVQIYHPDRMYSFRTQVRRRAEDKLKIINKAYTVLIHPEERATYDIRLTQQKIAHANQQLEYTSQTSNVTRKAIQPPSQNSEGSLSGLWSSFRSFMERFVG